jgi:hypothetical protein
MSQYEATSQPGTRAPQANTGWTTPAEIRAQLERHWERGTILAARINGDALFPFALRLKRPTSADLSARFDAVRTWVERLRAGSSERRGFGYEIEWRTLNHRVHGRNALPQAIRVPTEADALRLLGRQREAERFEQLCAQTLAGFPELKDWIGKRPLTLLERADEWPRILAVLAHFQRHPRPGCYLRQIDLPDVDTKFIEARRGLLGELLDAVLPEAAIDASVTGARRFNQRYGLREEPPLIRFRLLDPALAIQGLSDLSVPAEQFAALELPVTRVFITENRVNGLAFPEAVGALVIFGLGYGLERLAEVPWLQRTAVHYWGDLDTHGFAILDRCRAHLPHTRSLLMDRATLLGHRALWGQEPSAQRHRGALERLTEAEQALYADLRDDRLGERIRLEQERIGYQWVCASVAALAPARRSEG